MDTKWLEDFLALAEHGSFTRAAEARHVTQPAFSRRIRALENWLGAEVVDRSNYPTRLTSAGAALVTPVRDWLTALNTVRAEVRAAQAGTDALVMSTVHSLSVAWCPRWFHTIRDLLNGQRVRVNAANLHDCLDQFLARRSSLLLCYSDPAVVDALDGAGVLRTVVGCDTLVPVATPALRAQIDDCLQAAQPLPLVSFPADSFFGQRIDEHCLFRDDGSSVAIAPVFETALAEAVRALVVQGEGMSWLPRALVREDLRSGRLYEVEGLRRLELDILFCIHAERSPESASRLFQHLTTLSQLQE